MSNKGFAIFLAVVVLIGGLVGVVFAVGMSVGESKTDNKNQPLLNQNTDSNPAQTSLENSSETQKEVETTITRESDRLEGANEQLDSCLKENIGMGMEELRKVQTEGTAEEQEALRAKIEKVISESNISQPTRRQGANPAFQQRGQGGNAAFQQILGMCFRASTNSGN